MDVKIDITNTTLETERLILRPWNENDLDDLYAYASVEGVGEMAGWPHHTSKETSKRILDEFIAEKCIFAIEHKNDRRVIGSLGLHVSQFDCPEGADLTVKEIGYVLSKAYWGRGLMPEAVKAVINYCFQTLNIDALTVGHFAQNNQSRRVIEKCGFEYWKDNEYYSKQLDKTFADKEYILYNKNR